MRRLGMRFFAGFCGAAILGGAILGIFAATSSAGSANATFTTSIAPKPITAGEQGLITATFTNPAPGTVNHVLITISIDKLDTVVAPEPGPGCSKTSAPDTSPTVIECPVGQVAGGAAPVVRYVRFTAGSGVGTEIKVTGTASFDESGPKGGEKKAVKSSITEMKTVMVVAANADEKSGCPTVGGALATGAGGAFNLTTSFSPTSTPGICAPATIVQKTLPAGAMCGGSVCTTNASYVTFAGAATVTINFFFPPPGAMPTTFSVYFFEDETDTSGVLILSCVATSNTSPCFDSITRFPSERRIEAIVRLTDNLVDPGIAG